MDSRSKDLARPIFWLLVLAALVLSLMVHLSSGCCASTCETMLGECERGLEELHEQVATMCTCGLPEHEDGGCEYAAAVDR